jgi:hypothetical protein
MKYTVQMSTKIVGRVPELKPGEIITGNVVNGIENGRASGKFRPVVVVEAPALGCLKVIGFTSKGTTQTGKRRVEMLDNSEWGWRGRTFIFGERPTRLSRIDVGDHLGWISTKDGETLARMFGLDAGWCAHAQQAVA